MKKMNNKGFSLVELIVVIAIMAILVGVLAPTVIGQVEKSRVSKDVQAFDSLATAFATAVTEEMTKSSPSVSTGSTWSKTVASNQLDVAGMSTWVSTNVAPIVGGANVSIGSDEYKSATVTVTILSDYRIEVKVEDSGVELLNIKK